LAFLFLEIDPDTAAALADLVPETALVFPFDDRHVDRAFGAGHGDLLQVLTAAQSIEDRKVVAQEEAVEVGGVDEDTAAFRAALQRDVLVLEQGHLVVAAGAVHGSRSPSGKWLAMRIASGNTLAKANLSPQWGCKRTGNRPMETTARRAFSRSTSPVGCRRRARGAWSRSPGSRDRGDRRAAPSSPRGRTGRRAPGRRRRAGRSPSRARRRGSSPL